jgi:signal transduction histidine kinase
MRPSQHPEAAFLSIMTASATHEVRNVLAIIKESAGLIGDMVHVFAKRGMLDQEKVFRAVERIDIQVKRGADLLTNLNRLSHALDQGTATVELNQEVEQLVFLSQRFARIKGHRVLAHRKAWEAEVTVRPLHLQMVLFAAMERCLEELPEGAAISVGVTRAGEGHVVEFLGSPEDGSEIGAPAGGESWEDLREMVQSLGGSLERSSSGFGIRIGVSTADGR